MGFKNKLNVQTLSMSVPADSKISAISIWCFAAMVNRPYKWKKIFNKQVEKHDKNNTTMMLILAKSMAMW